LFRGRQTWGLDDPFTVPQVKDSYAALAWWDDSWPDVAGQPPAADDRYPYLTWAASHYAGKRTGKLLTAAQVMSSW
jgi:hypothetical protein